MSQDDILGRYRAWRVLDSRGLGAHSSWSWGNPPGRFAADEVETVEFVRADAFRGAVDDPRLIETLARVIENRHGTLRGIGSTLREALAEYKRGQ